MDSKMVKLLMPYGKLQSLDLMKLYWEVWSHIYEKGLWSHRSKMFLTFLEEELRMRGYQIEVTQTPTVKRVVDKDKKSNNSSNKS